MAEADEAGGGVMGAHDADESSDADASSELMQPDEEMDHY